MAARQLTKLEQVGILVGIVFIGIFAYLKFVNQDPGRKLKRTERELAKISSEVNRLRDEAKTGSVKSAVSRLRNRVAKARRDLGQVEVRLAQHDEIDRIANNIVKTAAEDGLMIKEFGRITDKSAIKDVSNGEEIYRHRYYKMTLKGRFRALREFLGKIDNLPKLIAVRNIQIEKLEEEALMRASLWLIM